MREIVHKVYLINFKSGDRLLELNAGTGTDALFLASRGIKVLATDISEKMVETANAKVKRRKAENLVETSICSFDEISTIAESDFDGVISNFGGFNCINDFTKLSKDISEKLKPGGRLIAVVMNSFCPWEIFYYAVRFDFANVFRRTKGEGIDASLGNEKVKTYYFAPGQFARFFDEFKVRRIYTLGLFTPPPFLAGLYEHFKPIFKLLMKTDEVVKGIFPFNRIGDHFIMIMEKI